MLRSKRFNFLLFVALTGFSGCVGPIKSERLGTLWDLKKGDESLSESLKQETKNFETLRESLVTGKIKRGLTKDLVRSKAGEPVVVYSTKAGEKWAYKSAGKSWFRGPKIYLFFDFAGELSDYQCIRIDCTPSHE